MPSIDTTDSIEINAPAQKIYRTVINYPMMNTWLSWYHCRLIQGERVEEGARIEHVVGKPPWLIINRFIRTVQRIVPGERIEETYDEGDLIGTGVWRFIEKGQTTTASYHCAVRANTLSVHLAFLLTRSAGHNVVYGRLLRALKTHCEKDER